jgi:hypothetical protein
MKALALAHTDAAQGKLDREQQIAIRDTIEEIVDDLDEHTAAKKPEGDEDIPVVSKGTMPDAWQVPYPVLCIASRSTLDEAACALLAHLLKQRGINAWVQPFADVATAKGFRLDTTDAPFVCLSYFGSASKPAHVRYLVRRVKRAMPEADFGRLLDAGRRRSRKSRGVAVGGGCSVCGNVADRSSQHLPTGGQAELNYSRNPGAGCRNKGPD